MTDDTKKDDEYKGMSEGMAQWGGRTMIDSMVGTVVGAAAGAGAAYLAKKPASVQSWGGYGSLAGMAVGGLNGSILDTRKATAGLEQFKANQEELKALREEKKSFAKTVEKERNAAPADDKAPSPRR